MKKILLITIACLSCTTTMGMIDNCAIAYDKEGGELRISLLSVPEESSSITHLRLCGTIDPRCWPNLRKFSNLKTLSLKNVNQCSFNPVTNWDAFFENIRELPIEILDLSHQLIFDGILKEVPISVTHLDLSHTSVFGFGLRDLRDRKMTIKITGTDVRPQDHAGTSLAFEE